ncbi:hypothetical protein [Kordiimonas aestuarii]|uniref:hypothetical protein n=1 Tax=Kordiimonas aestuarii TaxID=1005925 RepID=UPI0021D37918|nr:hypothetical protein [Kordiimonas aestuarii]
MNFYRPIVLLVAVFSVSACMSTDPSRIASTYWVPQAAPSDNEARWVEPGDIVLVQEVRPEQVAAVKTADYLSAAAADLPGNAADGPVHVTLHQTRVGDRTEIYCLPRTTAEVSAFEGFLIGKSRNVKCFRDTDQDGAFDEMYDTYSNLHALPIVSGKISKPETLTQPLPYVKSQGPMDEKYFIEIRYSGIPLLYRSRRNFTVYGKQGENDPKSLTTTVNAIKVDELPAKGQVNGATFEIQEVDGDRIKIKIVSAIPPSPITVFTQTSYQVVYY